MFVWQCLVLLATIFANNCVTKPIDKNGTMVYLMHFGFMNGTTDTMYEEGIKRFQKYAGIAVTGVVDNQTQEVMAMPRCGSSTPEVMKLKGQFHGSRWKSRNITYTILDYPKNSDNEQVDKIIEQAFNDWSIYTNITFTRASVKDSIIKITFLFQPVMKDMDMGFVVGSAKYPIHGGDISFSSLQNWTFGTGENGISLYQVAVHEIGHSIGLLHSSYPKSIMSPYLDDGNNELHPNDKKKAKLLYNTQAKLQGKSDTQFSICKLEKIDAIISYTETENYVFNGNQYWLLEAWTDSILFTENYPQPIARRWSELPNNIDAAYVDSNSVTYFFKGRKCWKFIEDKLVPGYPHNISLEFPGIPNHLDAAMAWEDGNIYFFKENKYWQFNNGQNPPVSSAYPKPISDWGDHMPSGIDAALYFDKYNAETYFFKDMLYYRYDQTDAPLIRKFPRPTKFWWFNC